MPENKKIKILVIEDESPIAEMISDFCKTLNFETKILSNGENVLEVVNSFRPDLITLDLVMTDFSGLEVLEILRMDDSAKSIPVIIISSIADNDTAVNLLGSKVRDILAKPLRIEELKKSVEKALSKN